MSVSWMGSIGSKLLTALRLSSFLDTLGRSKPCEPSRMDALTSVVSLAESCAVRDHSCCPSSRICLRFRCTLGRSVLPSMSAVSCSACCRSSPKPALSSSIMVWL
uniref:Putative secreted protein n=1 Tax=Ixodes ricinus TaxID=34613 RepID=A0A6B0UHV7_IXORI